MAEGVDAETWRYHLNRGDYSRWFREGLKDEDLADEAKAIERRDELPPQASLDAIRELIERRYTRPSEPD
ncbi:hypothetical protein BH23PLA1_BH23PLA1_22370 [soil metagenome]